MSNPIIKIILLAILILAFSLGYSVNRLREIENEKIFLIGYVEDLQKLDSIRGDVDSLKNQIIMLLKERISLLEQSK